LGSANSTKTNNIYVFAALIFAHLALAAAEIFFLAAALIFRLPLAGCTFDTLPLAFAHLAFCAAAILALAAALIFRRFRGALAI
jgi:membrane protein implicated in regulation of membrane protease activity